MHHNDQIRIEGVCSCKCHVQYVRDCKCGLSPSWRDVLSVPRPASRKMRKVNLESRVKQFTRTPSIKRNQRGAPISVTKEHYFHGV